MKILHIIDSGGFYGAEVMLLNLMEEQIKQGIDPTIASIGEKIFKEKPIEKEAMKRGFKVKKFRMRLGPNFLGAMKILRFAKRENFDIMHSHGYKGNILFGFIPKSIRKIIMVSTIHGWTHTNNSFSKISLYEWLDSKSLKFIDTVILVSNAMKSHLRLRNLDPAKVRVIQNGIPIPETQLTTAVKELLSREIYDVTTMRISRDKQTQETQSAEQTKTTQQTLDQSIIDFCSKGFTIGSIGRLSTEKGYKYLVKVLSLLVRKGISTHLIIIGEGYERENLERLAAQFEVTDRVMLPGYREDAKQYLSYFNVFMISSLTEGLPITLLEAMLAKVPVVASKVGGIPDALENGNAGILVESSNTHDVANAIIRIYEDNNFASRLIEVAFRRVNREYSSNTMAMQYFKIYNELI